MKNIDWSSLGFGYTKTDYNVRCHYKDGKWGALEVSDSESLTIHMASTCLHYGQEAFEGLKAFRGKDGKIRVFRCEENAKRMISSANYVMMKAPPVALFTEAVLKAIEVNVAYVPPYESGASLYIRPLLIGVGSQMGVAPAKEFLFVVFVAPVGPYFKAGFKPVKAMLERKYDRAAPNGTGHIKVGGNYAAGMLSTHEAHEKGYALSIFLDSKEKKYIDECGPANFFGIKRNTYVTPSAHTILPSITNDSLMTLAAEIGLTVERRKIPVEELTTFEEAGGCGTAAVISPVSIIDDSETGRSIIVGSPDVAGPWSTKLYNLLRAIQYGDAPDKFGWITFAG
ncbi:MAG: branched-chain amino acid aminotransferase [Odoribacteraceae bacterium]|jgi:branched-chain amino acid aminotransferase|nr:branched-chain amino acid aminotransferase [Odoribacteraceae bacterium]